MLYEREREGRCCMRERERDGRCCMRERERERERKRETVDAV